MADKDTSGINKLRKLSRDVSPMPMWVCLRCGNEGDLGGYVNATVREVLNDLADQIERERAEELAAAKRDLTDEAREAVERLLKISPVVICTSTIASAVGVEQFDILDDCKCLELRDRLIELIEHGGKQGVDVAALRELADDMDKRAHGAYGKTFVNASMYAGLMHGLSKRIRKAVEGAPKPDAESDAERSCAALLDWRDQVAGLLGIDGGGMADEVQDAIMAELDKRLMPPGMAWPRFDDGGRVDIGDEFAWAGNAYKCDAVKLGDGFALHCDEAPSSWYGYSFTDRVKRPEPEVLGADGEPIKVGETVYDGTGNRHVVVEVDTDRALVEFDGELKRGWRASFITHTPPDTRAALAGEMGEELAARVDSLVKSGRWLDE